MRKVHSGAVSDESSQLLSSEEKVTNCKVEMDISLETWFYVCKSAPSVPWSCSHAYLTGNIFFKYCLGE